MQSPFRAAIFLGLPLLACSACSSTYTPRPTGRISVVQDAGKPVLVKNGQRYEFGIFGGGLMEAVSGNRTAEQYAESFANRTKTTMGLNIGGVVFTLGGAALLVVGAATRSEREVTVITGSSMLIAGLGLILAGSFVALSAPPVLWDAINSYNDTVGPPMNFAPVPGYYGGPFPPGPPGTGPAPTSPAPVKMPEESSPLPKLDAPKPE